MQVALQNLQGIVHTVHMAPLIAMRGVNPSSDEAVANVTAGAQSGFHVAAIMRIHIHSVIGSFCLGGLNQFAHHLIGVGAAGVLGADGDLPLRAGQPMSTEMASVTPAGTEAAPPWPTSS